MPEESTGTAHPLHPNKKKTMQRGFTKLFNTIVTSTIWQEDDETRIVWITMLAIADEFGNVFAAIPGLANVANVPVEATQKALNSLLSSDKWSRTKDFDGKRIEAIDGGWHILNYGKYRKIMNAEERKDYKTKWMADKRKQLSTVDKSGQCRHRAEAEAEVQEKEKEKEVESSFSSPFSQRQKHKQPAPYYPPPPPHRIPTDQELETAKRIANQETQKLKAQLYPSTPIPNTTNTATGSFKLTVFSATQPTDHSACHGDLGTVDL
jgi:hypothetical protein